MALHLTLQQLIRGLKMGRGEGETGVKYTKCKEFYQFGLFQTVLLILYDLLAIEYQYKSTKIQRVQCVDYLKH